MMVNNQMQDDVCVYLNSQICKCDKKNENHCVLDTESQMVKVSIFHLTTHVSIIFEQFWMPCSNGGIALFILNHHTLNRKRPFV
jgi:hypothetical protein